MWQFETGANWNNYPITVSTEGTDIINELHFPPGEGIFYNRYNKPAKDVIKYITELLSDEGKVLKGIGIITAKRIKQNDPE